MVDAHHLRSALPRNLPSPIRGSIVRNHDFERLPDCLCSLPNPIQRSPDQSLFVVCRDNERKHATPCIERSLNCRESVIEYRTPAIAHQPASRAVVDTADYVLWRNTNGQSITAGTGVDGIVNTLDYDEWRANFGNVRLQGFGEQPSFGAGSTVPEPPAPTLITLAIAVAAHSEPFRFGRVAQISPQGLLALSSGVSHQSEIGYFAGKHWKRRH